MTQRAPAPQPEAMSARLRSMGLEVKELPGGRAALVSLGLSARPFESPAGALRFERLCFATVGEGRIKCLWPQPLFYLPLLSIAGCERPSAIEERVRSAWARRLAAVARADRWLRGLGAEPEAMAGGAALALPLGLEDASARAVAIEAGRLILPGRGPLAGIPLARAADRVFEPDPACASALELELGLTTRLEELARTEASRATRRRLEVVTASELGLRIVEHRSHRILLVGPRVGRDPALSRSLHSQGHRVEHVRSLREAVAAFGACSYELVLADAQLDRAEGIELIPALGEIRGVDQVPIVLVDERARPSRREAARRLGAAGYVVAPIDGARLAGRLGQILESPGHRRFFRYPRRLSVRCASGTEIAHTHSIGRGGMSVHTRWGPPVNTLDCFEISLPEMHLVVRVDAEVVHHDVASASGQNALGLRFTSFRPGDERALIAYLQQLDLESSSD